MPSILPYAVITEARGDVEKKQLDEAVERILTVKMRFGLFDNPFKQADAGAITAIGRTFRTRCRITTQNPCDRT